MKSGANTLIGLVVLFLALGCTPRAKPPMAQPSSGSHHFPSTEVIGDTHVRLIVDHGEGDMALVFEDFRERPTKPVKCRNIRGKVTLPDGSVEEVVFKSHTGLAEEQRGRYYTRRSTIPRECGIFTTRGAWIKTASAFTIEVTVPWKWQRHQLTFKYEAPR